MQGRKRGGQPGNQNAVRHGRHSVVQRMHQRRALDAMRAEETRRHADWLKTVPSTDYAAICAAIAGCRPRGGLDL